MITSFQLKKRQTVWQCSFILFQDIPWIKGSQMQVQKEDSSKAQAR